MSPVLWPLTVVAAVFAARMGYPVTAALFGAAAMLDAVVTAFRWMGYGK